MNKLFFSATPLKNKLLNISWGFWWQISEHVFYNKDSFPLLLLNFHSNYNQLILWFHKTKFDCVLFVMSQSVFGGTSLRKLPGDQGTPGKMLTLCHGSWLPLSFIFILIFIYLFIFILIWGACIVNNCILDKYLQKSSY